MATYTILRLYQNRDKPAETIKTGCSLEEAQLWCRSKETSWSTAVSPEMRKITLLFGPWFDGYTEER